MKNYTFNKLLLLSLFFIGFPLQEVFAQKFIAFVVTQEASRIGAVMDKARMEAEIKQIANITNRPLELYVLDRYDTDLASKVRGIAVTAEDVVCFYYSGHGAGDDESAWPVFVGKNEMGNDMTFKMTRIHQRLKEKGGKLTLTIYDACNYAADGQ